MNWLNKCINAALEYNEIKEAMGLSNAGFRSKRTQGGQPMITDKEILDAPYMPSALLRDIRNRKNGHWSWSNKKALDKIYERDRFIRRESADQARKEAADRFCAQCPGKEDGMCVECPDRAAILGETVKEGKTDAEKLAIAVKALESASIGLALYDGDYGTLSLVRQALKEIQ